MNLLGFDATSYQLASQFRRLDSSSTAGIDRHLPPSRLGAYTTTPHRDLLAFAFAAASLNRSMESQEMGDSLASGQKQGLTDTAL